MLGVLFISKKNIVIYVDGDRLNVLTFENTVARILESNNIKIGPKDELTPGLSYSVHDKDIIYIKKAVNVTVSVDDKDIKILSCKGNVLQLLMDEKIKLNPEDTVEPSEGAYLTEGMKVKVTRVNTITLLETQPLDYKTVINYDSGVNNTERRVINEGSVGERELATNVVYVNGKETARSLVKESVTKSPVDKVIIQGTYPLMPVSRGGDSIPYSRIINVKATAYSSIHGIGTTYTASGRRAVRDPEGYSTIAVDPSVIPLGTQVFVQGYGFAIAADTGSAVKGNFIDVYFDLNSQACSWAVKYVNVYILK